MRKKYFVEVFAPGCMATTYFAPVYGETAAAALAEAEAAGYRIASRRVHRAATGEQRRLEDAARRREMRRSLRERR